jgi:secondary thiamine-phosphate synthase enzyme
MIEIDTHKPVEVIDITSSIERALQQSKIEDGICLVYTLHTTTGLAINESDPDLVQDILRLLSSLVPQGKGYLHDKSDGNAHAHMRSMLLGNSVVIPVEQKKLILGTWQRVLFFELDGPRRRKILVRGISE